MWLNCCLIMVSPLKLWKAVDANGETSLISVFQDGYPVGRGGRLPTTQRRRRYSKGKEYGYSTTKIPMARAPDIDGSLIVAGSW